MTHRILMTTLTRTATPLCRSPQRTGRALPNSMHSNYAASINFFAARWSVPSSSASGSSSVSVARAVPTSLLYAIYFQSRWHSAGVDRLVPASLLCTTLQLIFTGGVAPKNDS